MVQFRWIKVSLSVMLLLQFTAVTGQNQTSIVRVGDDVTLPCENVTKDQDKCDRTTWTVSRYEEATVVELVNLGQISKHQNPKAKSDRLSVTEKCSLVITNVTVDDAGRYTCKQFNKSGKQQGPDSVIYLSVVNIEKQQGNNSVTLTCDVLTYRGCGYTVKWLYDDDKTVTETSPFGCSAIMTFSPHLHQKSNNVLVKCKVTDDKSGQKLLSHVSLESSGDKTGGNKTSSAEDDTPTQVLWIIIVAVGLAALLIVIVAVMKWKKSKGRETQMDGNMGQSLNPAVTPSAPETSEDTADPEGDVSYASVNFTRKTNSEARVCGDGDGDDDDDDDDDVTVTYSTIKASSSSAGASADLYATINKPKTNGAAV